MSKKKNILSIAACAVAVAGIVAMWVAILKGNGSDEESSGLIIIDESGSSVTNSQNELVIPEDGTILENVDIYKSHDYPKLSDEDFITLEELAENKDKYIQSMLSGSYDNFKFVTTPDFNVPEEIGRYQIATLYDYRENAEEAIKYMVGEEYDESRVIDMLAEKNYIFGPYSVAFPKESMVIDTDYAGILAAVGNDGNIYYQFDDFSSNKIFYFGEFEIIDIYYVADGEYADDTYIVGDKEMSISQYVEMVQEYIDDLNEVISCPTQFKQLYVVAFRDDEGNTVLRSQISPMYKSVPLWFFNAGDNRSEAELNLYETYGIPSAGAGTISGEALEYFSIQKQYSDYKVLEKYDRIVAPDKAAQLLSEKLAPDLNAEIMGMGLTYYPVDVGKNNVKELPLDGHVCARGDECEYDPHYLSEYIYELTPFWAFYFNFSPDIIGLVNCKTGEVSYLHNYAK